MKISELIHDLHLAKDEYGDIEVWVNYSCGCCGYEDDPRPNIEDEDWRPKGLYLN